VFTKVIFCHEGNGFAGFINTASRPSPAGAKKGRGKQHMLLPSSAKL
jgi:hypothetical protein